jgi:hypothetical protein
LTNLNSETRRPTGLSGASPVIVSIAAALSSLAFFRIWGLFSISVAGPGEMELSGASLAREVKGPIPWLYVTPVALLAILVISGVRLIDPIPRVRFAYSVLLAIVAATLLTWPADALTKVTHTFFHLQVVGQGSMRLTPWWWIYCVSLVAVLFFGIIELAAMISNYLKKRQKGRSVTR